MLTANEASPIANAVDILRMLSLLMVCPPSLQRAEPALSDQNSNHSDADDSTSKSERENITHVVTRDALSRLVRMQDSDRRRLVNQRIHLSLHIHGAPP